MVHDRNKGNCRKTVLSTEKKKSPFTVDQKIAIAKGVAYVLIEILKAVLR
ncbi:hypothetical protein [Butyrivibrio hungatei]|nr:hypothetical protein [Butyrivibrio hungatei]